MMPFEKCPVCGGELEEKEVEKLWVALQGNKVDSIASDHAEWPKEVKDKGSKS